MTRSDLVEQALGRYVHVVPISPRAEIEVGAFCGWRRDPRRSIVHQVSEADPGSMWITHWEYTLGWKGGLQVCPECQAVEEERTLE